MSETTHNNALKTGYQLHWYTIQSVLGQGAFGITYLAYDVNLERLVAIKEYMPGQFSMRVKQERIEPISDDLQADYEAGLQRFLSEARILTLFQHPNLVQVFNIFEHNNTAYMVMSYESGRSLKQILKSRKRLGELELMRILAPLLDGIEMMHRKGYIHRDIKPGNIFIRADNTPVLLDFGSARQTHYYFSEDDDAPVKTLTNFVSPGYTPIEQYTGKSDRQGPWTDIYSIGATLYKSITGKMPVEAVERSEGILHVDRDDYQPLIRVAEGEYSKSFLNAIDHALAFKAHERPQSIAEWRKEFGITEDDIDTIEIPSYQLNKLMNSEDDGIATVEITRPTVETEALTMELTATTGLDTETISTPGKVSLLSRIASTAPYAIAASIVLAVVVIINLPVTPTAVITDTDIAESLEIIAPEELAAQSLSINELQKPSLAGLKTEQFFSTVVETVSVARVLNKPLAENTEIEIEKETTRTSTNPQQDKVADLLAKAADNINRDQLTVPENNNAVYRYREVLKLDADNEQARRGLLLVTDKFMIRAYHAIENKQYNKAGYYIDKADSVTPGTDAVNRGREYLAMKQKQHQQSLVVARKPRTTPTVTQKRDDNGIRVVDLSRDVPTRQKNSVPDNDIDRTLNAIENLLE